MNKLSWDEICKKYDGQWVHLIDYDWEEGSPYPTSGVVHLSAKTRKEFNALIMANTRIPGARIYVGDIKERWDSVRMGCLVVRQYAKN